MIIRTLLQTLTQQLMQQQLYVSTAESCTGGMLAQYLTSLPGSSKWFERGWVTYSDQAKCDLLGVPLQLIQQEGVVSEAVARAMVKGIFIASSAELAIAITGIAGPGGESKAKPVGTVCFGFGMRLGDIQSTQISFPVLQRERIRYLSCCEALKGALLMMQ